jgi:predicted dehydrogenase
MIHENWRFRPQYRQAKMDRRGKTGSIREFRYLRGLACHKDRKTPLLLRGNPSSLICLASSSWNSSSTILDTARFLVGEMDVISTQTLRVSRDVIGEDVAHISLKAKNGAIGMVSGNLSAAGFPPLPQDRLELIGERSTILFDGDVLSLIGEKSESIHFNLEEAYQSSYNNAIAHFVEALRTGQPFETDRLDNLKTLKLVDEAYRFAAIKV